MAGGAPSTEAACQKSRIKDWNGSDSIQVLREGPKENRLPHLPHNVKVALQVVQRRQRGEKNLPRLEQMPQIGAAEILAGVATAFAIDRTCVLFVLRMLDDDLS